jgi:hypothetical protein
MFSTPTLVRRVALGAIAVAMVASVAACGSKSLTENFTSKITASDFQTAGTINGTMTVTVAAQKIDATFGGTIKLKGKDSAMTMSTTMIGSTSTTEQITIGDTKYEKGSDGTWKKTTKTASDTGINDLLGSGVTDKGVEAHNGQQLHRLETTKAVDPKAFFGSSSAATMSNVKLSLTFWAKDDGSPAGMTITGTWTQDVSGTAADATMTMDFNFDTLSGVTIEAPSM